MTTAQFAALKPGDRVVFEGIPSVVVAHSILGRWLIDAAGMLVEVCPEHIDLPDTETPPLFEEDGA